MEQSHIREYTARQSGTQYQISIWMPPGQPPEGGWPVVYVLDANAMVHTFVEAIQRSGRRPEATGIGMVAVVGIAHKGEQLFATQQRYRDYTFERSPMVDATGAGGGGQFLNFIVEQLAPELAAEFGFNAKRHSLFGHSLAGYFVLNALALRPQEFCYYAAISPSIWWQPETLAARLHTLESSCVAHLTGLFIAVGEWEGEPAPWLIGTAGLSTLMARRAERQMIMNAQQLATRLQPLLGKRLHYRCFPEEDHASIVMIAIQRSLRLMFA